MKFKSILTAAGILLAGISFQAQAATVVFTGVNTDGDTLVATGDFNFNAPNVSGSGQQASFTGASALNSLSLAVAGTTINVPSINNIVVNPPRGGANGLNFSSRFANTAVLGGTVDGFDINIAGLNFPFTNIFDLGASFTDLANDNLATTNGRLRFFFSQFNGQTRSGSFELTDISISNVSAVPVPAALPLLVTALFAIGILGRCQLRV